MPFDCRPSPCGGWNGQVKGELLGVDNRNALVGGSAVNALTAAEQLIEGKKLVVSLAFGVNVIVVDHLVAGGINACRPVSAGVVGIGRVTALHTDVLGRNVA